MIYYLMVLAAALCVTATFALNKYYQRAVEGLDNVECALRKYIPMGAVSALLFFFMGGCRMHFSGFTLAMAAVLSVLNVASGVVCFKAYEKGSISLFTMFQMQGGMLLPFIYGVAFADNALSVCRIIGIAVMIFSLFLPYLGRKPAAAASKTEGETDGDTTDDTAPAPRKPRVSVLYVVLCIVIFFVNGGISIVSYIHSNSSRAVDNYSFLVYYQLFSVVLSTSVYLLWCSKHPNNQLRVKPIRTGKQTAYLWVNLTVAAILSAVGYLLQLIGAAHLPAVAIYPMVTGGVVVTTSLAGLALFREKLSILGWLGICMTFVATVLFMF